ncbi:DUF488 domain-containing protein [Bifidobacterium parmae]|nr:DUF488 domain-containing protein [Bifidobacterium parmae]
MSIIVKRIYDPPEPSDGYRVLVDRLWPRGMSKQRASLDLWMKNIAPSPGLRKWFGHDPSRFDEFAERYRAELDANAEAVGALRDIITTHGTVTLLYAAKDSLINHAVVLRDYLNDVNAENPLRNSRS